VGPPISLPMMANEGKTFTIKEPYNHCENWYYVEENTWIWPVATFMTAFMTQIGPFGVGHTCEEGMTPICGWFICKHCGTNLSKIK